MNDAPLLRIAAVFAFLSPLTIFAGIPFAVTLAGAGGPGPIDFGDGAVLARLAELGSTPARVDSFALLGPIFALPATMGWYVLLRPTGRLAALGVALWYVGMVFIIAQDALQLALVSTLLGSGVLAFAIPEVPLLGIGMPIGIFMVLFWGMGFGVVMWREAARMDAAPAASLG